MVDRLMGLQGEQRLSGFSQLGFHVNRRCKNSLGGNVGMGVENMVKNLHAEMGSADFIQIRKGQGKAQLDAAQVLFNGIDFRTQVAARFFDKR